jgi:hypothetical protein
MYKFKNELPELNNIINDFKVKTHTEEFLNSDDFINFHESIDYFIDEFVNNNIVLYAEKDFEELLIEYLKKYIKELYGHLIWNFDFDLYEMTYYMCFTYFLINQNPRSYENNDIINPPDKNRIDKLINEWDKKEQPAQKTPEWYIFRWNGLTASSLWKCLDSQCNINSIIYQKCKPLDPKKSSGGCNIESPFHNGHKYEPLSILLYENWFNTKIAEVGALKHSTYDFLRASPDGINVKKDSPFYGRALEIKNPVNRELTGIPKKDYWIQMQLQMEVWDLNECDFLETIFKEYETEEEFLKDGDDFNKTKDGKIKGCMIRFFDGKEPIYKYSPLGLTKEEHDEWYDKTMDEDSSLSWIENVYWYLENYSLVMVPRNKKWFNHIYPQLKNVWDTILKERETGYEHRKPKKRKKKIKTSPNTLKKQKEETKDLLNLSVSPVVNKGNLVIKVRTQSFEEVKA